MLQSPSQSARKAEKHNSSEFGSAVGSSLVKATPELHGPLKEVLGSLSEQTKVNGSLLRELKQSVQELARRVNDSTHTAKQLDRHERELTEDRERETATTVEAVKAARKEAVEFVVDAFEPIKSTLQRLENDLKFTTQRLEEDLQTITRCVQPRTSDDSLAPATVAEAAAAAAAAGVHVSRQQSYGRTASDATAYGRRERTASDASAQDPQQQQRRPGTPQRLKTPPAGPATPRESPVNRRASDLRAWQQQTQQRKKKLVSNPRAKTRHTWQGTWLAALRGDLQQLEERNVEKNLYMRARAYSTLGRWLSSFLKLEEPERKGPLATIVKSRRFESTIAVVLVVNAVLATIAANYEMRQLELSSFSYFEVVFSVFYALELPVRLRVHKWYFFSGLECWWNIWQKMVLLPVASAESWDWQSTVLVADAPTYVKKTGLGCWPAYHRQYPFGAS